MMGSGIAAIAALAGNRTTLVARTGEKAAEGARQALGHVGQLVDGGLSERDAAKRAEELLETQTSIERAVDGADLVIESITENLEAKQELFRALDALAAPQTVITSNTSGLRITEIAQFVQYPQRTATTHFWFPAHLVPLVEVVMGDRTSQETAEGLRDRLKGWGKSPVIVKRDLPGQLANRILQAIIREAVNIVESGLASAEDVDTAIKAGMAIRFPVWGPLEHIDAVGLDLASSVQRGVLPGLRNEATPGRLLETLCEEGNLGAKSGRGFYDWSVKSMPKLSACRDSFIMETVRLLSRLREQGRCE